MGNKEKEFNDILDECLDRILFNGETPDQCLQDYPELSDELHPLLETAVTTSKVTGLSPDPAFKSRARENLFSYLQEAEEKRSRSFFSFAWQRRMATVIAGVLVVFAAAGGTAAASTNAMPDDFLYPVKLVTEKVQLAFTFTDLGKAEAYARMADRRIEEIVYMATQEVVDAEEIELLANDLNTNLMNIAEVTSNKNGDAMESTAGGAAKFSVTQEAQTALGENEQMDTGATEESLMIAALPDTMADDDDGIRDTATTSDSILEDESAAPAPVTEEGTVSSYSDEETVIVVEPTAPSVNVEIPPTMITGSSSEIPGASKREILNSTISEQAYSNISSLIDLLDVVPESVRPIIEKAIEESTRGYNNAIDSLD